MSKAISNGEIAPGQYLTVLENKPHIHETEGAFGEIQTLTQVDRSGMGEVLKVVSVDLPYVAVEKMHGILKNCVSVYDTRRTVFMELKPEFVNAILNNRA